MLIISPEFFQNVVAIYLLNPERHSRQARRKNDLLSLTIVNPSADGFSVDN